MKLELKQATYQQAYMGYHGNLKGTFYLILLGVFDKLVPNQCSLVPCLVQSSAELVESSDELVQSSDEVIGFITEPDLPECADRSVQSSEAPTHEFQEKLS